jgi:hypothetical protein
MGFLKRKQETADAMLSPGQLSALYTMFDPWVVGKLLANSSEVSQRFIAELAHSDLEGWAAQARRMPILNAQNSRVEVVNLPVHCAWCGRTYKVTDTFQCPTCGGPA